MISVLIQIMVILVMLVLRLAIKSVPRKETP